MIFQTFDDKKKCIAVFAKGKLYRNKLPEHLTKTWDYSEILRGKDVEYAKYYCGAQTLDEVCPDHLKREWKNINNKLEAFYRASTEAKLDLKEHCFFDLGPPHFLVEYGQLKGKICAYVFSNFKKPQNYEFVIDLVKVLTEIKNTKLNIDVAPLDARRYEFKVRRFLKKINKTSEQICFPRNN